jgi:hypothetical protein
MFNTGRDTSKGRALERDSRVVICVDDPHPPYSFVAASSSEPPTSLGLVCAEPGLDSASREANQLHGAASHLPP